MEFQDKNAARQQLIRFLAAGEDSADMVDAIRYLEREAPGELISLRAAVERTAGFVELSCEDVAVSLEEYAGSGERAAEPQPDVARHLKTCDYCRAALEYLTMSAGDGDRLQEVFQGISAPESVAAIAEPAEPEEAAAGDLLVLVSSAWRWAKTKHRLAAAEIQAAARAGLWALMPVPAPIHLGVTADPIGFTRELPGNVARLMVDLTPSPALGDNKTWRIRFWVDNWRAEFMTIEIQRGDRTGGSQELWPSAIVEFYEPAPTDAAYHFVLKWRMEGRSYPPLEIELPVRVETRG